MGKIVTIGETVLDIIFRDACPVAAKAGGSMLNTSVTLGRIGLPVSFISEYARDQVGDFVDSFLRSNGVDTNHVNRFTEGKTALALAFLDSQNNASYSFYKNFPEKRLETAFPILQQDDILLFGSFFAISKEVRYRLMELVGDAKRKKVLIIYDPNFRKAHLHELPLLKPWLSENFSLASLIKGSDEDFKLIYGASNVDEAFDALGNAGVTLIYTANSKGVFIKNSHLCLHIPVPAITPVSTIGAGDNFTAGIIYSLYKEKISMEDIPKITSSNWNSMIKPAIEFARHVCLSYDNYISNSLAVEYKIKN